MLQALHKAMDKDGNVQLAYPVLAQRSGVPLRQVSYVMSTLRSEGSVHLSKKPDPKTNAAAIWRLKEGGLQRLSAAA